MRYFAQIHHAYYGGWGVAATAALALAAARQQMGLTAADCRGDSQYVLEISDETTVSVSEIDGSVHFSHQPLRVERASNLPPGFDPLPKDQRQTAVANALLVLVLTNRTRAFLLEHDPMALKQASRALLDALPNGEFAPWLLERLRWDAAYEPGVQRQSVPALASV